MGPWVSPFREGNLDWRSSCSFVAFLRTLTRVSWISLLPSLLLLAACAPKKIDAGEWQCAPLGIGAAGASQFPAITDPVPVPWSTGFEDGFCGYPKQNGPGYCYGDSVTLVTEPHFSGHFAAEFKVIGDEENQTRCVRHGELPEAAYYSAWYYIPEALKDVKNAWNLWHFQGGDDPDSQHDLWDVSLGKGAREGEWDLMVLDRPSGFETYRRPEGSRISIPIGSWFHIELFLKRRADATGEIALYQDGEELFYRMNLKSEASKFTQWYVGDFAGGATPPDSHLYVDDVSISATRTSISATP